MIGATLGHLKKLVPSSLRSLGRQTMFSLMGAPFYRFGFQSYSQAGEDCVLRFLFTDCNIPLDQVSYLDIGSRHPTSASNTCMLYESGARGVCVDADITFVDLFRKMRPRDKVLNVGVSDKPGNALPLYFMEAGSSTFNKEEAQRRVASGTSRVLRVIAVPVVDINTLIRSEFEHFPMFLSIDVESLDLPVLRSLDFLAYPIPVICVETCLYSETQIREKDPEIAEFLASKGYEVYADTYINTIFVLSSWFRRPR